MSGAPGEAAVRALPGPQVSNYVFDVHIPRPSGEVSKQVPGRVVDEFKPGRCALFDTAGPDCITIIKMILAGKIMIVRKAELRVRRVEFDAGQLDADDVCVFETWDFVSWIERPMNRLDFL